VRSGDTVSSLTGVVDFGATGGSGATYKIHPVIAPVFSRTNPRTAAPNLPAANTRVASANVLNFFTTFTNGEDVNGLTGQGCKIGNTTSKGNCRGADNMVEFVRQRDKIVKALVAIDADVVGLTEIQNNGDTAVDYLVKQLNAATGFPTYAYVPAPPALGTDAIRVAMIYKPAKVALVGAPMSDSDAVHNRPPFAQTFKAANGAKFSVMVNHLKAKAGCGTGLNGDLKDGQGCHNYTRTLQAQRLANYFIPQVIAASGDSDVLVIGDMNAHGFEDPIHTLTQAGMVNELERFVRPNEIPYSYVFDGEVGYLDHALATASLDAQIVGATEWHTNADEPTVIDYNMDDKNDAADALYVNDVYRSSDHDPVIVAMNLTPTFANVTASFSALRSGLVLNRVTGKYTGSVTLTNTSGAPVNGPFQVRLDSLPAGVTLDNATGTNGGAPYITVSNASIAAGGKVTLSLVFSNPNKVGIGYNPSIFSGTF
jgi:predicted extracellular nuclease